MLDPDCCEIREKILSPSCTPHIRILEVLIPKLKPNLYLITFSTEKAIFPDIYVLQSYMIFFVIINPLES
jgi:hypothetical protein